MPYVISQELLEGQGIQRISPHFYRVEGLKDINIPKDCLVFRRAKLKKLKLHKRHGPVSYLLLFFTELDKEEKIKAKKRISRSLGVEIAPYHYIFPYVDYESLKNEKVVRPSKLKNDFGGIIVASFIPASDDMHKQLQEIMIQSLIKSRDIIKKDCLSPMEHGEKEAFLKRLSSQRTKLKIFKIRCEVFSFFFQVNLNNYYMQAYKAFNKYKKSYNELP